MHPPVVFPVVPRVQLHSFACHSDGVQVEAATTGEHAACTNCGRVSTRVHSRYVRTLTDRPLAATPLRYRLTVRRFVCGNDACPRRVFAEPLPEVASPRARTTADLTAAHTAIGFTAGGEPGSRLARALAMPTSPDTLLRRVRAAHLEPGPPPRYVGLDDWAVKKGQQYGTMVVDLERGRVVALLPSRPGSKAVADWLRANPQVQVITRDRWTAYASAATTAAPQATQVADRWHLLKNLREAVEGVIARFGPQLRAAAVTLAGPPTPASDPTPASPPAPAQAAEPPTARELKRQARRDRRQRVRDLHAQGLPLRAIARQMRMSRETVRATLRGGDRPHGRLGQRGPTSVDGYRAEVEAWVAAGGTNTAELHRQLRAKGCRARYDAVRRFANRLLGSSGQPGRRSPVTPRPTPAVEVPSARQLSFQFLRRQPLTAGEGPAFLDRVRGHLPRLDAALEVAAEFAGMTRRTTATPLAEWVAKATASGVPELARFAAGLQTDEAAVIAALTTRWSNGPVEGQVGRLKAIKRQMFGRANLDLLAARVLRKG
jgi:transposase